jgi:hypothetical protein
MLSASAGAQEPAAEHQHDTRPVSNGWTWATDANVFVGYNYQQRHFADFSAWESQNWFMGSGDRSLGCGRLSLESMLSLEAFTLHRQGSSQLFQTGESYKRTPLVNYQHPHDLFMGLGAAYRLTGATATYVFGADLVGSPTLGPTAFMHRDSARDNPEVPITHHFLDSTHITPGVVRAGVEVGPLTFESSAFRGAEPNEDRTDIERPRLDSWAARVQYNSDVWHAQVSGGHMRLPEWFEPYDVTRITASLAFDGTVGARPLKLTMAWGGNREFNGFNGNADGYLLEWDLQPRAQSTVYGRAEVADKDLFGLGFHPKGLSHRHVFYKVGALTGGYVFDLPTHALGRLGVGADATFYRIPEDLLTYWAGSHSYHVFLRWRPSGTPPHRH